ncbi:MAG: hypothetical protein CVU63_12150 [Deltaproteobacteria bacterium HGW-Deltaproteobacteria-20]|nr:MAG: hypothetical protein CVU63_12150 [Deltaproteobacteria bacterium HGW-Deltaproteobacteria-20]
MSGAAESTTVHTSILRCMLATEDADAHWRRVDLAVPYSGVSARRSLRHIPKRCARSRNT